MRDNSEGLGELPKIEPAENFLFVGSKGLKLNAHLWTAPSHLEKKGTLLGSHGYSEHGGRYAHFAAFLNQQGYDVLFLDLPGHGLSEGRRADCNDFGDYVAAIEHLLMEAEKRKLKHPYYLFGHSLGGLVTTRFLQSSSLAEKVVSLTLSSPLFGLGHMPEFVLPLLKVFTTIAPNVILDNSSKLIGESVLTHDREMIASRLSDPLIRPRVTFHWLREFLRARTLAFREASKIKVPVAIFQSALEKVVSAKASKDFFDVLQVPKEYESYEGMYHEILNEVGREQVMSDMLKWLQGTGAGASASPEASMHEATTA